MNMMRFFVLLIVLNIEFNTRVLAEGLGTPNYFYVEKYVPESKTKVNLDLSNAKKYLAELKDAKGLYESGVINEKEFKLIKRKIIENF
jgi:hypothetical protein